MNQGDDYLYHKKSFELKSYLGVPNVTDGDSEMKLTHLLSSMNIVGKFSS